MTKEYIITNCPSIHTGWRTMYECFHYNKPCTDCTDCLFKQIVEKCKEYEDNYFDNDWSNGLSQEILSMLEIQECE